MTKMEKNTLKLLVEFNYVNNELRNFEELDFSFGSHSLTVHGTSKHRILVSLYLLEIKNVTISQMYNNLYFFSE